MDMDYLNQYMAANTSYGELAQQYYARPAKPQPSKERRPRQKKAAWRSWSDEDIATVHELRSQGITISDIAALLGRTRKAVEHICYSKPIALTGTKGKVLTEKELAWLKRHYKHTKNEDIQRRLNITFSSLHRLAREHGLKKSRQFMRQTRAEATQAAWDSHNRNGTFPKKGFVIPRSEEFRFKKGVGCKDRMTKRQMDEMHRRGAESWKKTRAADYRRFVFGLEQKTKFRFVRQGASKVNYRYGLRKCGYVESDTERGVFYFPSEEMRRPLRERNGARHGITFKPLLER